MAAGPRRARLHHQHSGRGRAGRRAAPRPRHRGARSADSSRGRRRPGPGRSGGGREPLLTAPQPGGLAGRRRRPGRETRAAPPSRPPLAAAPVPRPPATAGRSAVAPRHDQPAEPQGARHARHPGDDGVQLVRGAGTRSRSRLVRSPPGAGRRGAERRRALGLDPDRLLVLQPPAPSPAGKSVAGGIGVVPPPSVPPTGCSGRPRTGTDPSSNGWSPARRVRCCGVPRRSRAG